jgi:putative aldouronate transport system permease protein
VVTGIRRTKAERVFAWLNYGWLGLFGFLMLLPLLSVLSTSVSSPLAVDTGKVFITPVGITPASWRYIFTFGPLWRSLALTGAVTILGTALCLVLNALMAYPLSKKEFAPSAAILMGIAATMIFKAPIIPYFLTLRKLGLFDSPFVLIVPHLFSAYYLIIMVAFMRQIPKELEESAMIVGAGYMQILFRIILPSSTAMLASIGLFYAVGLWNQFLHPLLFIQNQVLYPLQLMIRAYTTEREIIAVVPGKDVVMFNDKTVKAAIVMFSVLPIVPLYLYAQKYFIKGVMVGSLKG